MRPLVTLCMIVKNEEAVIERALASVLPYIDRWSIVDTGSTDCTAEIIEDFLRDVPGELCFQNWVDFAVNRSASMEFARDIAQAEGYILVHDADDVFEAPKDWVWPELQEAGYMLLHQAQSIQWWRAQLFRADMDWIYRGEVHAFPDLRNGQGVVDRIHGPLVRIISDGHRRSTLDAKAKYLQDASVFERLVQGDPGDLRSLFYLAQSYRDAEEPAKAIKHYLKRATLRADEEGWYALYQAGHLCRIEGRLDVALELLQRAIDLRPERMEPVIELCTLYRMQKRYGLAHIFATHAVCTGGPPKNDRLFIDISCYGRWRALDALAVTEYYLGNFKTCTHLYKHLLANPDLPVSETKRIEKNLALCEPELPAAPWVGDTAFHQESLFPVYTQYTANVSSPEMALSLEACALLVQLIEDHDIKSAADLGSGLSSVVLRQHVDRVVSVDTDATWLRKTQTALRELDLCERGLYLWPIFAEHQDQFDLVVFDVAHTGTRIDYLEHTWKRVAPGGFLFIDDMHQHSYRRQVNAFMQQTAHTRFDVSRPTTDQFGRFGWLIQKPHETVSAA